MDSVEDSGPYQSASSDGWDVSSNTETAEQIKTNLDSEKPQEETKEEEPDLSKAASELGKKGGKASAESKRAKADADSDDGGEVAPEPEADKPLGKPRDDPKARMLEATRQAAELKRQVAAERAERERISQELAAERAARQAPQPQPKVNDPNAKPSVEDYDDYNSYVEANARWAARQEYAEVQRRNQVQQQAYAYAQTVDKAVGTYKERIDKVRAADPEFMDRVSRDVWDSLSPTFELQPGQQRTAYNVIADEVMDSEQAPAILLHFTDHPKEFQRIAALPNTRAIAREMAKLETRFEAASTDPSPKPSVSTAKPPVRSVTGSPGAVERDENDMSFEEFYAHDSRRAARR